MHWSVGSPQQKQWVKDRRAWRATGLRAVILSMGTGKKGRERRCPAARSDLEGLVGVVGKGEEYGSVNHLSGWEGRE